MKISINSGFQRGGSLLEWDGQKFNIIRRAGENTRVGDGDSSFTVEVPDNFKGAVVRFWGISFMSYCNSAELMGFTEAELSAPSPVKGWASCQGSMVRSSDDWRIVTMGDYLTALARDGSIFTIEQALVRGEKHPSGNGSVLVRLACEAGDQAAAAYAVLDKNGNILIEESGCGDRTPRPIETKDGWCFISNEEVWMTERQEAECRFFAAVDRGNLQQWRMVKNHLTASYRIGHNPLPTLRKKYGGSWTYFKPGSTDSDADEGAVIFLEIDNLSESYKGWMVIYKPAK